MMQQETENQIVNLYRDGYGSYRITRKLNAQGHEIKPHQVSYILKKNNMYKDKQSNPIDHPFKEFVIDTYQGQRSVNRTIEIVKKSPFCTNKGYKIYAKLVKDIVDESGIHVVSPELEKFRQACERTRDKMTGKIGIYQFILDVNNKIDKSFSFEGYSVMRKCVYIANYFNEQKIPTKRGLSEWTVTNVYECFKKENIDYAELKIRNLQHLLNIFDEIIGIINSENYKSTRFIYRKLCTLLGQRGFLTHTDQTITPHYISDKIRDSWKNIA
jgi:hypothetical protein